MLLRNDELFWNQRAKKLWIVQGDRMTKYFHIMALNRKRRNTIIGFSSPDYGWQLDSSSVQAHFQDYFQRLFSATTTKLSRLLLPKSIHSFSTSETLFLTAIPDVSEIRSVVFLMGATKMLGHDGLNVKFFKVC